MPADAHDARALLADALDAPAWVADADDAPGAWPADAGMLNDKPAAWPADAHGRCQLMLMMRGLCRLMLTGFAS